MMKTRDVAWAEYDATRLRGDVACRRAFNVGWNAAIESAAETAKANGDLLEIHSGRIAEKIRTLAN